MNTSATTMTAVAACAPADGSHRPNSRVEAIDHVADDAADQNEDDRENDRSYNPSSQVHHRQLEYADESSLRTLGAVPPHESNNQHAHRANCDGLVATG